MTLMDEPTTTSTDYTTKREATEREDYFFDLRGFLVLKDCLSPEQLGSMNTWIDERPRVQPGEWIDHVHRQVHPEKCGENLQQIYEAEPFRCLIDHPSWIEKVKRYVGGQGGFDALHGPVFIDENFCNVRGPGQAIGVHNGGNHSFKRCQYEYRNNEWMCGQINILVALNDVGPGDGATMAIPGSHKSRFKHPDFGNSDQAGEMNGMEGAVEVHLKAGDAILFVDSMSHGSAARVNPGERRICVFRYGPSWGNFRFDYKPSRKMLDALTQDQFDIVRGKRYIPGPINGPAETYRDGEHLTTDNPQ